VGEQGWDAGGYDRAFGYVSRHGRELMRLLAPVPGERVLDLGCGTGELAAAVADLGIEVCGIDADAAMIAQARALHPEIGFEQADGHDFVLADPVDAVLSNAALHWMLDPPAVIARVRAALRPGGRFVAEFGGQGNVAIICSAVRDASEAAGVDPGRIHVPWFFPSPAEYATLLEEGGFRVRLMEHFDRLTPLDDCSRRGRRLVADVRGRTARRRPDGPARAGHARCDRAVSPHAASRRTVACGLRPASLLG
jgi:trans-aconitate methyltransferase